MQRERIQKALARAGVASRRKIEEFILQGLIQVNGKVITKLGETIDPEKDEILLKGKRIELKIKKQYYLFYKPKLVLSTCSDQKNRKTVLDFFRSNPSRLYPVGRLDYQTDGLIIITNDGDFTYALTHPKHDISKQYSVHIKESISPEEISMLSQGLMMDGYKTQPCQIKLLHSGKMGSWLEVTLYEGRNRQIRNMMDMLQKHIVSLTRTKIGICSIGNLSPGEYRILTREEVQFFLSSQTDYKKEYL